MSKILFYLFIAFITLGSSAGYDFEYETLNRNDQYSTAMIIGNDGRISNNVICHYTDGNNYVIQFNNPELSTYFRLVQDSYYTNCYYLETKEEWSCCIHHGSYHSFDLGLYRYDWVNDDYYQPTPQPTYYYTPQPTYTWQPTAEPTIDPTYTWQPTSEPTIDPTYTWHPTSEPTVDPTYTWHPTSEPTIDPTFTWEPTPQGCPEVVCMNGYTFNSGTCTCDPAPSCQWVSCMNGYTFSYDSCMCEQSTINSCPEIICPFGTIANMDTCTCESDNSGSVGGGSYNGNENNPNLSFQRRLGYTQNLISSRTYYAGIHCNGYPIQSCECCGIDSQCTNTYYNFRNLQFLRQTRKLSMSCTCPTDISISNGNGIFWSYINQEYIRQTITSISCPSPSPSPSSYVYTPGDCTYAYLGYFQVNLTPKSHGPFRMAIKLWSPLEGEFIFDIFNLDGNTLINYVQKKYIHIFQIGNELHFKKEYNGPVVYKSRISDYIYIYFLGDGQGVPFVSQKAMPAPSEQVHYWDFFSESRFYYLINPGIYGHTTYQGANYQILFNDLFYVINCVSPSASPSPTSSITPSRSSTPSVTSSSTPSITPTFSPTSSVTPSLSPTPSVTMTPSSTPTISITSSSSPTPSQSATPSITPSITPSPSCVWSALSCDPTGQFCTVKNVQNPCVTPTPVTQPSQIPGIKVIRIRTPKTMRVF